MSKLCRCGIAPNPSGIDRLGCRQPEREPEACPVLFQVIANAFTSQPTIFAPARDADHTSLTSQDCKGNMKPNGGGLAWVRNP